MRKTVKIAYAALFASLIAVCTAFIKFNTGINSGYLHFGDGMIYLAASVLPLPYALSAAAIGGALADIMAGAAVWAVPTAIIKALNVLPFVITKNKILASILSGVITVVGYFVAESLLYTVESAVISAQFSLIQAVGSAIIYCVFSAILKRNNVLKEFK